MKPVASSPEAKPAPAALSLEDIRAIRERIEAPAVTAVASSIPTTTADQLVALVSDTLAAARDADAARIAALEEELAKVRDRQADSDSRVLGLAPALESSAILLTELGDAQASVVEAQAEVARLKNESARAEREMKELRATAKLTREGAHVLGAETVATLLETFLGSFQNRLGTLQVGSADICLRAGFAALNGGGSAFVIPSAHSPQGDHLVLHEIRLRLDPKG